MSCWRSLGVDMFTVCDVVICKLCYILSVCASDGGLKLWRKCYVEYYDGFRKLRVVRNIIMIVGRATPYSVRIVVVEGAKYGVNVVR